MLNFGIEFEFFISKDGKILPAYEATENLDGNPFLGEIKTGVHDNIASCVFDLQKEIFLERKKLEKKGFSMEIVSENKFSRIEISKSRKLNTKVLDRLETFSIYPSNNVGKVLGIGEVKASLQLNISNNNIFLFGDGKEKTLSELFNYNDIIKDLDILFEEDIKSTRRVKGVYAIKYGVKGNRIEYRSLPNTIDFMKLIDVF